MLDKAQILLIGCMIGSKGKRFQQAAKEKAKWFLTTRKDGHQTQSPNPLAGKSQDPNPLAGKNMAELMTEALIRLTTSINKESNFARYARRESLAVFLAGILAAGLLLSPETLSSPEITLRKIVASWGLAFVLFRLFVVEAHAKARQKTDPSQYPWQIRFFGVRSPKELSTFNAVISWIDERMLEGLGLLVLLIIASLWHPSLRFIPL